MINPEKELEERIDSLSAKLDRIWVTGVLVGFLVIVFLYVSLRGLL